MTVTVGSATLKAQSMVYSATYDYNDEYMWISNQTSTSSYSYLTLTFSVTTTNPIYRVKVNDVYAWFNDSIDGTDYNVNSSYSGGSVRLYVTSSSSLSVASMSSGKLSGQTTLTSYSLTSATIQVQLRSNNNDTDKNYRGTRLRIKVGSTSDCAIQVIEQGVWSSSVSISNLSTYTDSSGNTYYYNNASTQSKPIGTTTSDGYPTPTNYVKLWWNGVELDTYSSPYTMNCSTNPWAYPYTMQAYASNSYGNITGNSITFRYGYTPYIYSVSDVTLDKSSSYTDIYVQSIINGPSATITASSSNENIVIPTEYSSSTLGDASRKLRLTKGTSYGTAYVTYTIVDDVYGTSSKQITVINSDTPIASISASKSTVDKNETITFYNYTTTYSSPTTYTWLVDSLSVPSQGEHSDQGYTVVSKPSSTSKDSLILLFDDSGTYTITLEATSPNGYSDSTSTNITVLNKTDSQTTRYKVVLFDSSRLCVALTRNFDGPKYHELSFEKRLDETGQGSMRVFFPSGYDKYKALLQQNTQVIIFDEMTPIYCGVITEVTPVDNAMFGKTTECFLYDVNFEDAIRNLSYSVVDTPSTLISQTTSTIAQNIIPSDCVGDLSTDTTKYTYTINAQSRLSLLESFSNQCGCRYRTTPNICSYTTSGVTQIGVNSDSNWYYSTNRVYVLVNNLQYGICNGDLVFGYSEDKSDMWLLVGIIDYKSSSSNRYCYLNYKSTDNLYKINMSKNRTYIRLTYMHALYPRSTGSIGTFQYYNHYKVDFKESYYQTTSDTQNNSSSGSVYTFEVNKNTYNVNDDEQVYNHYGVVTCYSPQSSGYNIPCTIKLNNIVNKDSSIEDARYITASSDTYIYNVYAIGSYLGFETVGTSLPTSDWSTLGTNGPWIGYCIAGGNPHYLNNITTTYQGTATRYINGNYPVTVQIFKTGFSSTYDYIQVGYPVFYGHYTLNKALPNTSQNIQICGETIYYSSSIGYPYYTSSGTSLVVMRTGDTTKPYLDWNRKAGSIILYDTAQTGSPYSLYGNQAYSCQLQDGMSYDDVAYMASKIARFGSNQTKNVTGTSGLQLFEKSDAGIGGYIPLEVGDHVDFDRGTNDNENYELVAYTINADKMTVEYEAGMKKKNIGDVVYTINSNMSTNIN